MLAFGVNAALLSYDTHSLHIVQSLASASFIDESEFRPSKKFSKSSDVCSSLMLGDDVFQWKQKGHRTRNEWLLWRSCAAGAMHT